MQILNDQIGHAQSIADHLVAASWTRILNLQPINQALQVEGMPALKNRMFFSFF
jgi:NADH/NAD ratio-sensing transcriptional regulator Rex